jgi:hypothetical protein
MVGAEPLRHLAGPAYRGLDVGFLVVRREHDRERLLHAVAHPDEGTAQSNPFAGQPLVRPVLPPPFHSSDTGDVRDIATPQPRCRAMQLLDAGIPLTLLIDLCTAGGLDSRSISAFERRERQK